MVGELAAGSKGHKEAYEFLTEKGADAEALNNAGEKPELHVEPPSKFDNCCVM